MKDFNDKLIILLLKSKKQGLNNLIITETVNCECHFEAIKNIEKTLFNMGEYYCAYNPYMLNEIGFYYTSYGNLLIGNIKGTDSITSIIYIPEIIDETDKKFIQEYISTNKDNEIYIEQKDGEIFRNIDIANFMGVKVFTHDLQKKSLINK